MDTHGEIFFPLNSSCFFSWWRLETSRVKLLHSWGNFLFSQFFCFYTCKIAAFFVKIRQRYLKFSLLWIRSPQFLSVTGSNFSLGDKFSSLESSHSSVLYWPSTDSFEQGAEKETRRGRREGTTKVAFRWWHVSVRAHLTATQVRTHWVSFLLFCYAPPQCLASFLFHPNEKRAKI